MNVAVAGRTRKRRSPTRGRKKARRGRAVGLRVLLLGIVVGLGMATILPVVAFRWLDPPTSAVMMRTWVTQLRTNRDDARIDYRWVPWKAIAPTIPIAMIAGEDQRFPRHHGFDVGEIRTAIADHRAGAPMRGASTITQQVAKNLFLWSGRSWIRKGMEAYLTTLIELTWTKRRILEVYVNIAQLGPSVFGVGAASEIYFGKSPHAVSAREAALLAAVLPNPIERNVTSPSPTVLARATWIRQQVVQLGGATYLDDL